MFTKGSIQDITALASICDVFGVSNLVTTKTCSTKSHISSIDVILINWLTNVQKASAFETSRSSHPGSYYYHTKTKFRRLIPKLIKYCSYKISSLMSFYRIPGMLRLHMKLTTRLYIVQQSEQNFPRCQKIVDQHVQ